MKRRDFLGLGALAPVVAFLPSFLKPQKDELQESFDVVKSSDSVFEMQWQPEFFDFLDDVPPGMVVVFGQDDRTRTLVAHAVAERLFQRRFAMLYDAFFPYPIVPRVPVWTNWDQSWMFRPNDAARHPGEKARAMYCWLHKITREALQRECSTVIAFPQQKSMLYDPGVYAFHNSTLFMSQLAFHVRKPLSYEKGDTVVTVIKSRLGPGQDKKASFRVPTWDTVRTTLDLSIFQVS